MMDRALDQGIFDRRDLQTLRLAYGMGRGILGASGISGFDADTDLAKLIFQTGDETKASGRSLKGREIAGEIAAQACAMLMERQPLALCA